MTSLREWHALGTWPFLLRMVAIGSAAGVASWAVALIAGEYFVDISTSTGRLLVTSVFRGVVVGGAVGILLDRYWSRKS